MANEQKMYETLGSVQDEITKNGYNSNYPEAIMKLSTMLILHINEHANKEGRGRPYEIYADQEVVTDIKVLSKELNRSISLLQEKIAQADDLIQRAGSCMDYVQNKTWGTPVERTIAKLRGEKENGK